MTVLTLSDNTSNFLEDFDPSLLTPIEGHNEIVAKLANCQRLRDQVKAHMADIDIKLATMNAELREIGRKINRAFGEQEYQSWLVELEMQLWAGAKPLHLEYRPPLEDLREYDPHLTRFNHVQEG